jgi:hypothetical protein
VVLQSNIFSSVNCVLCKCAVHVVTLKLKTSATTGVPHFRLDGTGMKMGFVFITLA